MSVDDNTIRVFEGSEQKKENSILSSEVAMQQVRALVKQMKEIDEKIVELRDDRKELVKDFVDTYNVPMKEVKEAIKMLKSDIDPDVTAQIYAGIADLVEID